MDLFINMVHGRKRHLLESVYLLIGLVIFVIITIQSGNNAWIAFRIGDTQGDILRIPVWPAKASVSFGSFFLSLRFIRQLAGQVVALFCPSGYQSRGS